MKTVKRKEPKITVRELTIIGMLGAITLFLGLTGFGFIVLPWMKATIMQIPTIIGALLAGPRVGLFVGLIFGSMSVYQNIVVPNVFSAFFINPLVSVLPRLLIGPAAYYVYRMIRMNNESIRLAIGAAIGSLTNTVGVLGMIYILYAREFAQVNNWPIEKVLNVLIGVAVANGGVEAIITSIIVTSVVIILKRALGKRLVDNLNSKKKN